MRLLKIKVSGLKLFSKNLEIDFTTLQRVIKEKNEMLYKISPQIYQNKAISFIGINASGKTSTLKVISFIIQMLNNKPINNIKSNEILSGISGEEKIVFELYFSTPSDTVNKLVTIIKKDKLFDEDEEKYIIEDEKMWSKDIKGIKTKKSLFVFDNMEPAQVRDRNEEFLADDVSIVIALNKRNNSKIYCEDLINWTNINLIRVLGDFPKELITFLDSSIEYLESEVKEGEKKITIRLKFKGKEEIVLYSPLELEKYLSSGTIKGINVFVNAMMVLSKGGYLLIDELENHFNKEIVATLVRFFMKNKVNKKGATILFTTHYPELLDEFERNDNIYIVRNEGGISVENLSNILTRNDIKKSEIYQSGYLQGTVPAYTAYMDLKKSIMKYGGEL
ncbi:MAG: ATP-binding protein [Anaeromicrobium sp.]|uniref:AAA family ATPase n=1 Tax=Anaeromicrobium sp. TaxID=1929132 RepID=UPI0025DDAB8A|nr:AAA family ATPase [Anaeromicrobium sp.]MCT4592872.1 ATP-binding protein [Anaeromicrobium sp.]